MGKKSRRKRERRKQPSSLLAKMMRARRTGHQKVDIDFQRRGTELSSVFSRYNAEDVALALGISDLWLPNISSQVKHHFALGIFLSMNADQFVPTNRLDTYTAFCDFINAVHALLPSFAMLEDFVPEPDWGEIRVDVKGTYAKIFYGCNVERIPDFIEAFRLLHSALPVALNDMNVALTLQNRVISLVRSEVVGSADGISPGHLEIPSEVFWLECGKALSMACDESLIGDNGISSTLVLEMGRFRRPPTWSEFGDAVMSGTSLPGVMANVNGKYVPLSLRNATTVVIDFWGGEPVVTASSSELDRSMALANFLIPRFESDKVVAGPLRLVSRRAQLPDRFAAVFRTDKKFYFIIAVTEETLDVLGNIEQEVRKFISDEVDWAFLPEGSRQGVQFRKKDGTQPRVEDVVVLAILVRIVTSWMPLELPETNARFLSLTDFVTIFDSLEDPDELDRFWTYVDTNQDIVGPMSGGPADLFGSFRDSNALLVDGAFSPTMISLDPHWGSNWRHKELSKFWAAAPTLFPDDTLAWKVESKSGGLHRLIAKGSPTLAWATTVGGCSVHVLFRVLANTLDSINGRMLELFVHCLADAIEQRQLLLEGHPLFSRSRIVIECRANEATPASESADDIATHAAGAPLMSSWRLIGETSTTSIAVSVEINLAYLQSRLDSAVDASFEVECALEAINGISSLIGITGNSDLGARLLPTSQGKPRFIVRQRRRLVDVPDFSIAETPKPEQYKIARRDLAVLLKGQGVEPGWYELARAKVIIDPARDEFRAQIHARVAELDRQALLIFCIEQHDALIAKYQREVLSVTQSLQHEVSFDRSKAIADAHDAFTRNARNYRYLIECCISAPATGSAKVRATDVVQIIASINWLFVLYGASDILHNDIDVGGVELDYSYIPQVFYSINREAREGEFALEIASAKLGIDLVQEDEVNSPQESGKEWAELDQAFLADLGFSFTHLSQMLLVLAQWHAMGGESELRLSYRASPKAITNMLKSSIQGLADVEADRLVDFATLVPNEVRRLLGKTVDESDVPVWEHNKRGSRYAIRPFVAIDNGLLAWGAAAADRAAHIWTGAISNGYLPADFDWPHVKEVVRQIKSSIEQQLEVRAFEVFSRATIWVMHGIDFKFRFPNEGFEDVGDFDVLAYWPALNRWVSVECKYNQPPFCLKDSRRLRDRIFGTDADRGQFAKIERRRSFFTSQRERLRMLLGWPEPSPGTSPIATEVYVCRDIYWWMRNPPFEVPTHFVRIDGLDGWLRSHGLQLRSAGSGSV